MVKRKITFNSKVFNNQITKINRRYPSSLEKKLYGRCKKLIDLRKKALACTRYERFLNNKSDAVEKLRKRVYWGK